MKTRDPYPITDVYLLEMNAVDAATVTVGDLCERLSNDFDTGIDAPSVKEVTDHFKNIDASKYNSISYGNGADGGYSVYIGVDAKNRIRKIFADATVANYAQHPKDRQSYLSWWWDKEDFNDQFFNKVPENRIKLFDITGNLLFSKKFYYDSFSFNISSLSSGMYILRLENDLGLKNKKLIIR